jgi:hypothetical protein
MTDQEHAPPATRCRSWLLRAAAALCSALVVLAPAACDDESDTGPGGSGAPTGTAGDGGEAGSFGGAGALGGSGGSGGLGGAGGAAEEHPCVSAEDITAARYGFGTIDAWSGESDYFRFSAPAGEPVQIRTKSNTANGDWFADPVVTVLSEDGATILATDDADSIGYSREAELVFRSLADETYCLQLEHYFSWSGQTPVGTSAMSYELFVKPYSDRIGYFDLDEEPNDDDVDAQDLLFYDIEADGKVHFDVIGELDSTTDVDVYRVPIPSWTNALAVKIDPPGPGGPNVEGTGSTLQLERVDVTDVWGNVYSRITPNTTTAVANPFVNPGSEMLVWVVRKADTSMGGNDFYRLKIEISAFEDYQLLETEAAAGGNDTLATADYNSFTNNNIQGLGISEALAFGWINPTAPTDPIDIDYWALVAMAGSTLELRCFSASVGSGVVDLAASVVDSADNVMQSSIEIVDPPLYWNDRPTAVAPPLLLPYTGVYYLRVTAAGQLPDVYDNLYACSILVLQP